jgi:hypothetical protein
VNADEAVLDAGVSPTFYASTLLAIARELTPGRRWGSSNTSCLVRRPKIESRIRSIVRPRRQGLALRRRESFGALAIMAAAAIALGLVRTVGAQGIQPDFEGRSEEWRHGFALGREYAAEHPFGSLGSAPPWRTASQKRNIERSLRASLHPPDR